MAFLVRSGLAIGFDISFAIQEPGPFVNLAAPCTKSLGSHVYSLSLDALICSIFHRSPHSASLLASLDTQHLSREPVSSGSETTLRANPALSLMLEVGSWCTSDKITASLQESRYCVTENLEYDLF